MNNIESIIGDWNSFLDKIFVNLNFVGINVDDFILDHIAYRATTEEMFSKKKVELNELGKHIHRITIRNRFIDIYQFNNPIVYDGREISYFEILAPAEGDKFLPGLEHAEFVIKENLYDFVNKHNDIKWNINSIDRKIGAEVGVLFENGASVKFKNESLPEIIKLEAIKL